jgi:hypothetical protein
MAKLPDKIISTIFSLQRRFLTILDETTAMDFAILKKFGETEITISELDQLQNIKERAISSSQRLYTLSMKIAEAQPFASDATLELLSKSIMVAEATINALEASLIEIKKDYDLP